jgi:hypothetical protein
MFRAESVLFALFTVMSMALLAISLIAYHRSRKRKMLVLSMVFFAFLAKGILITVSLFMEVMGLYEILLVGSGIDTLALMLLYASTMRV